MAGNEADGVLSIEQVLAEEADAIDGGSNIADGLDKLLKGKEAQKKRFELNADERDGIAVDAKTIDARKKLYRQLNELRRGALCFSGGGIRSATFCLGILQALAACDANRLKTAAEKPANHQNVITPESSLLGRFHYLSTVSGGGYVGSWLSAWRKRASFAIILGKLTNRPSGPDFEPWEISWLRAYSNYLTPRIGIASADTWAAIAIVVRNLVLNWLIIIPVVCLALLALKIIATVGVWIAHGDDPVWAAYISTNHLLYAVLLFGIVCLIVAQIFTTLHRPPRRPPPSVADPSKQPGNAREKAFLWGDFIWAVFSAIVVTIFFASQYFSSQHGAWVESILKWRGAGAKLDELGVSSDVEFLALTAVAGFAIYALGWIFGWIFGRIFGHRPCQNLWDCLGRLWDFIAWALSGLIYGALVGLGAILYLQLRPYPATDENRICLLLAVIFGVPWVLMAQLTADNIFGGLVSYGRASDSDREWLGRAAGWLAAFAIAWAIVAFLVFVGGDFVQTAKGWGEDAVTAAGGVLGVISGIVTALLGKSSATPAKSGSGDQANFAAIASNVGLAVAGPIFAAVLIIALSVGLDELLLGGSLVEELQPASGTVPDFCNMLMWLGGGLLVAAVIARLASYFVNINRFSLHALYRNRLIRAYLGATRDMRHPDRFTGFDSDDNVRMHELWPPEIKPRRLFHIVNIALNVVSTKRLAWQERKAESFTVSPRHCGSAYLGFRPSQEYGDSLSKKTDSHGITLGTAMAISGAAVSPNMGYHSSPSTSLLLTLFNVRLGWWLGNPGQAGNKHEAYRREGPGFAAKPLFNEAFGQTTDKSALRLSVRRRPLRKPWPVRNGAAALPVHRRR